MSEPNFGYLADGSQFYWPDKQLCGILAENQKAIPVRGFKHVLAVFENGKAIGWIVDENIVNG